MAIEPNTQPSGDALRCSWCGRELPLTDFYRDPRKPSRPLQGCKACRSARYRRLMRGPDGEKLREQRRLAARRYRASEHGRRKTAERSRAYVQQKPRQKAAKDAVYKALRDGRLIRQPCAKCGTTSGVQAHHHDYTKPLDVVWLCPRCHAPITLSSGGVRK